MKRALIAMFLLSVLCLTASADSRGVLVKHNGRWRVVRIRVRRLHQTKRRKRRVRKRVRRGVLIRHRGRWKIVWICHRQRSRRR